MLGGSMSVWLVSCGLNCFTTYLITTYFFLVKSNLVKLETTRVTSPTVSVVLANGQMVKWNQVASTGCHSSKCRLTTCHRTDTTLGTGDLSFN